MAVVINGLTGITTNPGTLLSGSTIGVGGTTPSASGAGISFPATQSPSTDVNTLDDYEEGTFNPIIVGQTGAGTGTYTNQVGRYTKVGNRVFFQLYVSWSAHTGTGNMLAGGLPFTSSSDAGSFSSCPVGFITALTLTANYVVSSYMRVNDTNIQINQLPVGGGSDAAVAMDSSAGIVISGHYFTS